MTANEIFAVALREIGYHEGRNKDNKYGRWYGLNNAPWCMEFVQWVYAEAGEALPVRTPSCGALLNWYKTNQPECITDEPVEGCIVIFDFPGGAATDHTGIFVSRTDATVTTIDGNTSGVNDDNGGWVAQKTRTLSYARPYYVVPRCLKKGTEETERFDTLAEIRKKAPWAAETVEKLVSRGALNGTGTGLDLSMDMIRLLVIVDRAGGFKDACDLP